MSTKDKIQHEIERNNRKMEHLQHQAMQYLEHIAQYAKEALERGDARIAQDTLDYDIRHLTKANEQLSEISETNRMLEYLLKDEQGVSA